MSEKIDKRIIEVETIFGPLLVFENDVLTQHVNNYGAHTRTELAFLLSAVEDGDYVFDIGAHVGSFAIPLAQKVGPRGKVLAVEGASGIYDVLVRNIGRRGYDGYCSAINALIAPHNGPFQYVEIPNNTGASHFMPAEKDDGEAVCGQKLDALFQAYFVPRVIKMDIEGFEYAILKEAALAPAGNPIIFSEISDHMTKRVGGSVYDFDHLLKDRGYLLFHNAEKGHARNDDYTVVLVNALPDVLVDGKKQFNILAVHKHDRRLASLRKLWGV